MVANVLQRGNEPGATMNVTAKVSQLPRAKAWWLVTTEKRCATTG